MKKYRTSMLDSLNPQQRKIVEQTSGILLVCAGAGSGKTKTITARIAHVINEGADPRSIAAVTFTNKAAQEMRKRIKAALPHTSLPFIGTFHAYCLQLLRRHHEYLKTPHFSIIDESDQRKLVQKILKQAGLEKYYKPRSITSLISDIKNRSLTQDITSMAYGDQRIQNVIRTYEQEKQASHCFDFDDLLRETVILFQKNKNLLEQHQAHIRHMLVDEYQDTNYVQHALLKTLARSGETCILDSLCVVGDEDQTIYSWRGATIDNILYFKQDFPGTQLHTIEQNYRSADTILEVANGLIAQNENRNPKKLWSAKQGSDRVRSITCMSSYQESELIGHAIKACNAKQNDHSTGILYRSHYQSRSIEESLMRHNIPYTIIGGIEFYQRQEIKDILAYLKLVVNPYDRVSFMRCCNTPSRGLGDKFQEAFLARWDREPLLTCIDVAEQLIEEQVITGKKAQTLKSFVHIFQTVTPQEPIDRAIDTIIEKTQYLSYLQNSFDEKDAQDKSDNVKELLQAAGNIEMSADIATFLHDVALVQKKASQNEETDQHVYLMTLHASKGLEFDFVMLTGLEDGIFPSARSTSQQESIEEERRLLYVGITRAKDYVLITNSKYRFTYGQMNEQRPSRFLHDLPAHLVKSEDASFWQRPQFTSYFSQWLGAHSAQMHHNATSKPTHKHETDKSNTSSKTWKKHQPVKHSSYGVGIIEDVEQKAHTTYLTIRFSSTTKKLSQHFVEPV
jgi:DNA helicase-2/ATP-dependent DNA helicase PcrA